jgi:hypothetical protein
LHELYDKEAKPLDRFAWIAMEVLRNDSAVETLENQLFHSAPKPVESPEGATFPNNQSKEQDLLQIP